MNNAVQLDFNEMERCLWPALHLLEPAQPTMPAESILVDVAKWLRTFRARGDDDSPPEALRIPRSAAQAVNWLYRLWQELSMVGGPPQRDRRRALIRLVLDSRLPDHEQSRLLTAIDYLCRLAEAQVVARAVRGTPRADTPSIRSPLMQSACRKLVSLASTALPIWLAGEKGTELDWMARLAHAVGGGPPGDLHVRDFTRSDEEMHWTSDLQELGVAGGEATVVARRADRAPQQVQRLLHDLLVGQLSLATPARMIVTSEPIDITDGIGKDIYVDLFAFLYPSLVQVPPLRNRPDDIAPLMSYFAVQRRAKDPAHRLTSEAMEALRAYHWPGNVEQLEMVTAHLLESRPTGDIRLGDLPETVCLIYAVPQHVLSVLQDIHEAEGFRALATEAGRRDVARFLAAPAGSSFRALDFMKAFDQGKETARRLLASLMSHGLVEGVKGSTQQRITRYRRITQPFGSTEE